MCSLFITGHRAQEYFKDESHSAVDYGEVRPVLLLTLKLPKKQTTKFSSAKFKTKKKSSKAYHIQTSKTRGQTV